MQTKNKSLIYWILQDNQITPFLTAFLELIAHRTHEFLDIRFMVPDICHQALKDLEKLKPLPFPVSSSIEPDSYQGYDRKRNLLGNDAFSEGLCFYQPLLLDDLGGGNIHTINLHIPENEPVKAVMLQIPTPLGSSETEERIFYAWVHWAKAHGVPVIGYELLPLDTRWTLAPSLVDGIIATRQDSYDYLTSDHARLDQTIWLLPRFEGKMFSPATPPFWRNGLGYSYTYQGEFNLDPKKTVLYIPHNVAMVHEYKKLLQILSPFKDQLHLMFCIGKDQVRGAHSHQEIIEIVCKEDLKQYSYSFHDLGSPYEMAAADGLVAASTCYGTVVSAAAGIPGIVFDPVLPPAQRGCLNRVNTTGQLCDAVSELIESHNKRTELSRILLQLSNRSLS